MFNFDPVDGLNNVSTYPNKPSSGAAARAQIQGRLDEIKNYINKHGIICEDTGIENELIVTIPPTITTYSDLLLITKVKFTNTSSCVINVNSLGNVAIKKKGDISLTKGDLTQDSFAILSYDDDLSVFQLLNISKTQERKIYNTSGTAAAIIINTTYADFEYLDENYILFEASQNGTINTIKVDSGIDVPAKNKSGAFVTSTINELFIAKYKFNFGESYFLITSLG